MQIKNKILLKEKITEAINYFNLFDYPISAEEIYKYSSVNCEFYELQNCLDEMVQSKEMYCVKHFYSSTSGLEDIIDQRLHKNKAASKILEISTFYTRLLSYFPFVRAIAITGSLSKNCANENSDIDYFVMVESNRVWICKTLVQMFKNVLRLFGKEEFMCANYFKALDNEALEEKSKFTEMELITMIPVYGEAFFQDFFKTNRWAYSKYPNLKLKTKGKYAIQQGFVVKKLKIIIEFFISLLGANRLDNFLMKQTKKRWIKAHFSLYKSPEEFDRSIKIRKNEIKYHLNNARINPKV